MENLDSQPHLEVKRHSCIRGHLLPKGFLKDQSRVYKMIVKISNTQRKITCYAKNLENLNLNTKRQDTNPR